MESAITFPLDIESVLQLPHVHFRDRGYLPENSAIYFVVYSCGAPKVAYVGKAKSLKKRWIGHHRIPECVLLDTLNIAAEIYWWELETAVIDEAEKRLIAAHAPPLNDRLGLNRVRAQVSSKIRTTFRHEAEILSESASRREHAIDAILSDSVWNCCNSEDGDLICVWPFPGVTELVSINDLWMYSDNHDLIPSRVPYPPTFYSDAAAPEPDYESSTEERKLWLLQVARQCDCFINSVALWHAASIGLERQGPLLQQLLSDGKSVEATILAT